MRSLEQGVLLLPDIDYDLWSEVKDGHPAGLRLYRRHYSSYEYKDGRKPKLFVGPGEKMVLLTRDRKALFVWRKFISLDHQEGINCAVFRNESRHLSSVLLQQAMERAFTRWPGERLYTYVDPGKIKSANPGYCFKVLGWHKCGETSKGLHILEYTEHLTGNKAV